MNVEDKIKKIFESEPVISIEKTNDSSLLIEIQLPYNCILQGDLSLDNTKVGSIGVIFVKEELRGRGIAGLLYDYFYIRPVPS